ncbi:unnamed protein product [Rotaria socialis]|uniref:Uncharacterized protein n=1 Tax=Rotaria socialis TaxID=392032 RepID=A0A821FRX6_9BILA|nr:unnamed protein product [Rotaria socialis]
MSDRTNDENSTLSASSDDETTNTSEMVLDEINHTTHDEDAIARALSATNGFNLIDEHEISIQTGDSQPSQGVPSSLVVSNFMFENQPVELERDHGSPISAVIIDNEPDITTLAQNANIYDNIISPFDLHNVPAPLPVAVNDADDEIQILLTESNAVETAESPAQVEPNNDDIRNSRLEPIVVIDLTDDEAPQLQSSAVVPRVLIDLTQDENEEEVQQTTHVLTDENMNPPQHDPVVDSAPTMEAPGKFKLIILRNRIKFYFCRSTYGTVAVHSNETIDNRAQVSTTMPLPRAHKRSMSSIEQRQADKNRTPGPIKRWRKSTL